MKSRLDDIICKMDPGLSKSKAQAMIMSGMVYVDNQKETKCGSMFPEDADVEIRGEALKYVSRGGLKLEKGLETFPVDLEGKVCMDIGASTGGFTDCMLQNGARKVYSVDVGKGQLDWKLRNDDRVVVMEKTNIRYVTPDDVSDVISFISIDVSFISLTLVIPVALNLMDENKEMIMLIKPQFEAGRDKVGKKGVVRDAAVHEEVIAKIISFAEGCALCARGLTYSPVKGPEGNIEYLLYTGIKKDDEISAVATDDLRIDKKLESIDAGYIKDIVEKAHKELNK